MELPFELVYTPKELDLNEFPEMRDVGNLMAATTAYRECLELDRRQRMRQGDTPCVCAISQSVFKSSAMLSARRVASSDGAYRESSGTQQAGNWWKAHCHAPDSRDLSISLHKLGDVEREAGRFHVAMAAYRESELQGDRWANPADTPCRRAARSLYKSSTR